MKNISKQPVSTRHAVRTTITLTIAVLAIAGTAALSACNTTAGAGRDMSKLGNNIENSANRNK